MHHLSHSWISTRSTIGAGFKVAHVCGIVVHPKVIIGENCTIRQNVTIGGNYGKQANDGSKFPRLGDNVSIGPSACILGPIFIGSNTIIGANSVVTTSVSENAVIGSFRAEAMAHYLDGEIQRDSGPKIFLSRRQLFERLSKLEQEIQIIKKAIK